MVKSKHKNKVLVLEVSNVGKGFSASDIVRLHTILLVSSESGISIVLGESLGSLAHCSLQGLHALYLFCRLQTHIQNNRTLS